MKKAKHTKTTGFERLLEKRKVILAILGLIFIIGLPLRMQNVRLEGYISDDAWWHYRHTKEVLELGHRLNPDIYEFTTLNRPMTYPPLFHYLVAYVYKLFSKSISLIKFTHYFNIIEGLLYTLIIYWISYVITSGSIFSLIGALSTSVSYGLIIRARAGELMPFVPSDLFALWGILVLLNMVKVITKEDNPNLLTRSLFPTIISGLLLGLSLLTWNGAALIYLPLFIFIFFALLLDTPKFAQIYLKLFLIFVSVVVLSCVFWYIPLIIKYGFNPHTEEIAWFMKGFTVLHQVKPPAFYILTTGISVFFIPLVFFQNLFKRDTVNLFFLFWIVLGLVATSTGWRGYIAVIPIISCIAISLGLGRIVKFLFKGKTRYTPWIFSFLFLSIAATGYYIADLRLNPLNPKDINEVRFNEKSIKMLDFINKNYPDSITVDHITWISEDEVLGRCRMVNGQYLEYLPRGSSQAFIDVSKIYFSEEEEAFKICKKYNVNLIIVRKQFLQLPQLSLLFAPPELKFEDYLKVTQETKDPKGITVSFTPKGMKTLFFRMLSRQSLKFFESIYQDIDKKDNIPYLLVYKVKKD